MASIISLAVSNVSNGLFPARDVSFSPPLVAPPPEVPASNESSPLITSDEFGAAEIVHRGKYSFHQELVFHLENDVTPRETIEIYVSRHEITLISNESLLL